MIRKKEGKRTSGSVEDNEKSGTAEAWWAQFYQTMIVYSEEGHHAISQ